MIEEWRIISYAPNYKISNTGKIYKFQGPKSPRMMKTAIDRYGYEKIQLSHQGQKFYKTVHRLVAEAFIPNPNELPEVNHKDGDKLNNSIDNLEWCSQEFNLWHSYYVLGYDSGKGENNDNTNKPCQLYIDDVYIESFRTIQDACQYAKENYSIPYTQLQKHYKSRNAEIKLLEKCND